MIAPLLSYINTHRVQLTKFVVFGFLTFGINIFCFHLFYGSIFKLNYKVAVTIAYIVTVCSHFVLNRTFTYKAVGQKITSHVWRYVIMLVSNYLLTLLVVWFVVNIVKSSPYLGLVASTGVGAMVSFFVMKYFVFGSHEIRKCSI